MTLEPEPKFDDRDSKAIRFPSAEIAGSQESPSPCDPFGSALTSVICAFPSSKIPFPSGSRSTRKMSEIAPLASFGTRFDATLSKTTKRPSAEIAGNSLKPFASEPSQATLIRTTFPVVRSATNTSLVPFVS